MTWLRAAVVGCSIAVVCAPAAAASSRTLTQLVAATQPITHAGVWMVDSQGRVVITHGVDIIRKATPFYPPVFSAQDAKFLVSEGFTGARIGFIWQGAEPAPGVYDTEYLKHVVALNALLGRYGVRTLIDFHQDAYSEKYGGDGAPLWASLDDVCGSPLSPVACNISASTQAFQNLWDHTQVGGTGLTQHFAGAWTRAAALLQDAPNILGYDLFNEPYAGSSSPCALFSPCPTFEQGQLATFYRDLIAAVRTEDRSHLIFYEPVPQATGAQTLLPAPLSADSRLGFTYHFYARECGLAPEPSSPQQAQLQDAHCAVDEGQAIDAGINYAKQAGTAIDLGEFGDSTNETDNAEMVDLMTQRSLNWAYWEYNTTGSSVAPGLLLDDSKPGSEANADQAKLDSLVVPYPEEVAGTPQSYSFDRGSNTMKFTYATAPVSASGLCPLAPTEIFVPRRKYPHGYQVQVTGARLLSAPTWPWVELLADASASTVSVTITPRSRSTTQMPLQAIDPAPANDSAGCTGQATVRRPKRTTHKQRSD